MRELPSGRTPRLAGGGIWAKKSAGSDGLGSGLTTTREGADDDPVLCAAISENTPLHCARRAPLAIFNPCLCLDSRQRATAHPAEFSDFAAFIGSLTYPPNPNHTVGTIERLDRQFLQGVGFFTRELLFAGNSDGSGRVNCSDCHTVTGFNSGTNNTIFSRGALRTAQDIKSPHLRGLYQKWGMNKTGSNPQGELTGFGFTHDGSFDTLVNLMRDSRFDFRNAGDAITAEAWRASINVFLLTFDTGTAPTVGMMTTVTSGNKTTFAVTSAINLLMAQAARGNCDLVVSGLYGGSPRSFLRLADGRFQPDSALEAPVQLQTLVNAAGAGAELTFMGVPVGAGRRLSIAAPKRSANDDEVRALPDHPGRWGSRGSGSPASPVTLRHAVLWCPDRREASRFGKFDWGTKTVTRGRQSLVLARERPSPTSR